MGMACTRIADRVLASMGQLNQAPIKFSSALDIRFGGVLLSLPALLANGLLLNSSKFFSLPKGFYNLSSIFIMIAFLALARIKSLEGLRYLPPGDLGKLLGLDRIPEVRTMRNKLSLLSQFGDIAKWRTELSRYWMSINPDLAGFLYIDGHVRVYYGSQTKLPRRYVARQRLCLRGTTDYWVNDAIGQPFFYIEAPVNPGLIKMLRDEIVPRLEKDVPNQPSESELSKNPYISRFGIVFDREGYSPEFFLEMQKKRIACYTYRKYQDEDWRDEEFEEFKVKFPNGEEVEMRLAERGTFLGKKMWVREIRKLTISGHQTSLVTTDLVSNISNAAASMFSRWCQENFFKYMMENFGIDRLVDYETKQIDDTTKVVNPEYRKLDSQIRKDNGKLSRKKAEFGCLMLEGELKEENMEVYIRRKSELQEDMSAMENKIEKLKEKRKASSKHIEFKDLPDIEKFLSISTDKKHIVDTIKMVAYRAETGMVKLIKPYMSDSKIGRSLLRQVYNNEADIDVDEINKTLTVSVHNMTNPVSDNIVKILCDELNKTETVFPGTNLRLIYKLVSE